MQRNRPSTSRRDLLKTLGLAGVAAGGGVGALPVGATAATTDGTADDQPVPGSSDVILRRERGVISDQPYGGYMKTVPGKDSVSEEVGDYVTSTAHSLAYLDTSWEPVGSPADGGGCWRHTFALSSLAFEQYRPSNDAAWRLTDFDVSNLQDNAVSVEVPSEPDVGDPATVGVGARRNPSLYTFADPGALKEAIADGVASATRREFLARLRSDLPDDPDPRDNWFTSTVEEEAKSTLEPRRIPVELALHADAKTAFGTTIGLLSEYTDGLVSETLGKAGTVMTVVDLMSAVTDVFTVEAPPHFDRGFSHRTEGLGGTAGSAGHYLMFDVYTAPGEAGTVAVSSDYFGGAFGSGFSGSWRLTFSAGPRGPGAVEDPTEKYTVDVSRDDSITSREA